MDIESINDYLIEHVTGLSKAQIKEDVERIKDLRQEVSDLDKQLATLKSGSFEIIEENANLKEENARLVKIKAGEEKELNFVVHRARQIKEDTVLMQSELQALEELLIEQKELWEGLEARISEVSTRETTVLEKELELKRRSDQLERKERQALIDTKKNTELFRINSELVESAMLNKVPIHQHIKKLQKIMDKRGIKLDVLQELQSTVV